MIDKNKSKENLEKRLDACKDQTEADAIIEKLLMVEIIESIKKIPRNS